MASTITDFKDKVAVVTGGASGIGKGICEELLKDGAKVVIADVEKGAIDKAVEELSPLGEVSGVQTDVSKADSVEALAEAVYQKYGVCHLLFNNAAIGAPGANVWETTPNDWTWTFTVNVFGVAYGIQSFVPRMLAGGEPGYIINTSSGDGDRADADGVDLRGEQVGGRDHDRVPRRATRGPGNQPAGVAVPAGRARDARDRAVVVRAEPAAGAGTREATPHEAADHRGVGGAGEGRRA